MGGLVSVRVPVCVIDRARKEERGKIKPRQKQRSLAILVPLFVPSFFCLACLLSVYLKPALRVWMCDVDDARLMLMMRCE